MKRVFTFLRNFSAVGGASRSVLIGSGCLLVVTASAQQRDTAPEPADLPTTPAAEPVLPDNTAALSTSGATAFAAGRWEEAVAHYRELLAIEPNNPLALANLGQSLYRLGQLDEAAQVLERAIASEPRLSASRITLGLLHQREGRFYAAISALSAAVEVDPDNAQAHQFLGVVLHANGWNSAAQVELQRALQLDPAYATAHYNLAVTYLDERPPAVELARRHYLYSLDAGGAPDEDFQRRLNALAKANGDEPDKTRE